jgi:hypothetical protein
MRFKKGNKANPKGRPKTNITQAGDMLRGTIVEFLKKNFKKVICDFEDLSARDRVRVYVELFRQAIPRLKVQPNELNIDGMDDAEIDVLINKIFLKTRQAAQHNDDEPEIELISE